MTSHREETIPFDYQPVLSGDLLTLKPLRAEDWDELYAVASDRLIWEQHPASNRHEIGVFRDFFRDALASGGALLAVHRTSGNAIGSSRFQRQDDNREVEIGWTFLARAYWGGAYNGEMKRLMLEHAFRFVDSVVFYIGPRNMRSRRAVEKIGAVHDGMKTGADGRESVRYRITAAGLARRREP